MQQRELVSCAMRPTPSTTVCDPIGMHSTHLAVIKLYCLRCIRRRWLLRERQRLQPEAAGLSKRCNLLILLCQTSHLWLLGRVQAQQMAAGIRSATGGHSIQHSR